MGRKVKEFLLINLGLILVALGIYLFRIPNNFATGGVSAISIIVKRVFRVESVGFSMLVINVLLLVIGFAFIDRGFGEKTIYTSLALSGMVWLLERVYPISKPLTDDTMLELIFSILLPAIGTALVFNHNASTGGTDIIAKILSRYTHINIGMTLLLSDILIALVAAVVFGIKIGMYSVLGVILKGFLVDYVIDGLNMKKQVVVISDKPEEVKGYIVGELGRGATVFKATGAFTNDEKEVISTILNRNQAYKLRRYARSIDQKAFITISNTAEIIGKGFKNTEQ